MKAKQTAYERFLSHVVKKDGCWVWEGYKDNHGYGRLMMDGGPVRAHRLSYLFHKGPVPAGKYVLHRCDNRECTNPKHLYVGTHQQNMSDKVERGRAYTGDTQFGEGHSQAKLTNAEVYEIRASVEPNPKLAQKYGVTPAAIGMIKRRKTWGHLP